MILMRLLYKFHFKCLKSLLFKYNVLINRCKKKLLIVFVINVVYLIKRRL